MAPSSVAIGPTCSRAGMSPETTMLPGPSRLAFQTRPKGATRRQSSSTAGSSRPRTLVMPLAVASAAGLHRLAALSDDFQARLEVHRAGKDERRVFAQAEAGGTLALGDDLGLGDLEAFERRQAGDEDRRLADVGRFECVGGPFDAEPPQVDPENLAGPVEESPDRRQLLIKLAAHPHELGTLAGEQKGRFGH